MSSHFIENINIKSFKCFDNFKAENLSRVNLIGGKNNIGKTIFMEACCINIYPKDIDELYTTIMHTTHTREKLEYINKLFTKDIDKTFFENIKKYSAKSNINDIEYEQIQQNGIKEYRFKIGGDENIININEFAYERKLKTSVLFLDGKGFANKHLKKIYTEVQKSEHEEQLNKFINIFDNSIEKFKIFEDSPQCKKIDQNQYMKLSEFGDGLRNYISIISALYACKNSYLFIDEIDNGIHYTKIDKLWHIIFTISKQLNIQVFVTTHSKECIESFARVSKELKEKNISFVSLYKNKQNKIDNIVMNYKTIQDRIKLDLDNR